MNAITSSLRNKSTIVCDVDEVLVNISPKWISVAHEKGLLETPMTEQEVLLRNNYYLDSLIPKERLEDFHSLYFDDPNFYDDLNITPFAQSLVALNELKPNAIDKLHIVTKCGENLDSPCNISKKRWLEEVFKDYPTSKIEFHFIEANAKKDIIFDFADTIDLFVDDKPQNIADVLLAKPNNSSLKVIAIPALGYSALPLTCQAYAKLNNTAITYYNNIA